MAVARALLVWFRATEPESVSHAGGQILEISDNCRRTPEVMRRVECVWNRFWLWSAVFSEFRGGFSCFDQSEARKQCFLASDWSGCGTLPRKYRTLFLSV